LNKKKNLKEIDSASTKKVAEASARKKRRIEAKVLKAKEKAARISSSDIPDRQKVKEIQKLYKGALKKKVPTNKVYIIKGKAVQPKKDKNKKGGANLRNKIVDPRMKKDKRGLKATELRRTKKRKNKFGKKK